MAKFIQIPFNTIMKKAILENRKICTSRNKKYGVVGDYFLLGDNMYFLTAVTKCTLEEVATDFYKDEGFESKEEFIALWKKLHPLVGYVPKKKVFTHWFRKKTRTENSIPQKEE